jgi:hypothetical protein
VDLKKTTQVSAEHFCRAPPRTSECKACAHLDGCAWPPRLDWDSLGFFSDPMLPVGRAPLPPGGTGPSSRIGCCASTGATKHTGASRAIDEGSGMSCVAARQRTSQASASAAPAASKGPMNGSMGEGLHRVLRGTALGRSRGQVRVTTANGCFMAPRPTDAASGLLVINESCGRHTRLDAKLTSSRWVLSSGRR